MKGKRIIGLCLLLFTVLLFLSSCSFKKQNQMADFTL